jgi:hypothetical protein
MAAPIIILRFLRQAIFIRRAVHRDDAASLSLDDLVLGSDAIHSLLGIFSSPGGISAVRRRAFLHFLQTCSELFRCDHGGPEDLFSLDIVAVALGELGMDMPSQEWLALKQQLLQSVKAYVARAPAEPQILPGISSSTPSSSSTLVPFEVGALGADTPSSVTSLSPLSALPLPTDQQQHTSGLLEYERDDDNDDATTLCLDLDSMSREDLYTLVRTQSHEITQKDATIVKRDLRIAALVATCRTFGQKSRRLENRLQLAAAAAKAPVIDENFQLSRIGSRNLTPQGTIALGLRRNLGNIACADIGHVVLQDIDGTTVSRAEKKTGAALLASSKLFFSHLRLDLFGKEDRLPFNLAVHSFRTDGTNSSIWQRRKLYALELESAFLVDAIPDHVIDPHTGEANQFILKWPDMFERLKRVSDILPVEDGTGPGTVALIMKQLQALGCPTWSEIIQNSHSDSVACGP